MARLIAFLAALVGVLLGGGPPADAVTLPERPMAIYAPDSPCIPAAHAGTHYDRGPPLAAVDAGLRASGGPGPVGALTRLDRPITSTVYTYDALAQLVSTAHINAWGAVGPTTTTRVNVRAANGTLSLPEWATVAAKAAPEIKAGSMGGSTAGKRFPQSVKDETLADNPGTCAYCRMETDRPQVDHSIPMSRGGNATLDNAQTTCWWCNASKGARDFPVNPPPGFRGFWPPGW